VLTAGDGELMQNPVHQIRSLYLQVVVELKKCTWPTRQELTESTVVVIVSVAILTAFVAVIDLATGYVIRLLTMS
jgi:preprotein translocase subunit SecE